MRVPATLAASTVLLAIAACAADREEPLPIQPSDLHLVNHEHGTCAVCELYEQAQTWVLAIHTGDELGTGVVVSREGLVLTNAHVVEGGAPIEVHTFQGVRFSARRVRVSAEQDLALLRIEADESSWTPMALEVSGPPPVGSQVYAIGHPLGLGWTVTRGIVSAHRVLEGREMIQTDASISPGNSGGPLFNDHGGLVGIVTSKVHGPGVDNLAFARPMSAVLAFLRAAGVPGA